MSYLSVMMGVVDSPTLHKKKISPRIIFEDFEGFSDHQAERRPLDSVGMQWIWHVAGREQACSNI